MWVSGVGTHLSLCMYFRSSGIFEAIIWKAQPHALLIVKDIILLGAEIFFSTLLASPSFLMITSMLPVSNLLRDAVGTNCTVRL